MIVAVITVRMVQMPVNQVIDVVPMRKGGVPAIGAVHMPGFVAATSVVGSASFRVFLADLEHAFIGVPLMRMVQMPVVQIIDVIAVDNAGMTAAGSVDVGMVFVDSVFVHGDLRGLVVVSVREEESENGSLAWARALTTNSATCWSAKEY